MIVGKIVGAVRASDSVRGEYPELFFHRQDENIEAVEKERARLGDYSGYVLVDERAEYQRARAVLLALFVDLPDGRVRLFDRIDEGQGDFVERYHLELGQETVAEHLGSDAGAVGNEESGALLRHRNGQERYNR